MSRIGVFDDHKCTPLSGPEVIIQEDNDRGTLAACRVGQNLRRNLVGREQLLQTA